ncbi:MAG: alpha/beta fold hydrolase, partial [Microcoleaceae cyanobacterium]
QTSKVATEALYQALQKGYNRLTELDQITSPCLILAGEDDHHITASSSLETAQHLPQAESRCYPQTAHLFPWEISHQVLSDIDLWLNTHFPNTKNTHIKMQL